jgi:hypothetical protein
MNQEKEFDKEAAMLAALTGGMLNNIDKSTDRSGGAMPANRIDVNSFINTFKHGGAARTNYNDQANRGYVPEDLVQSLVPDTSTFSKPQNIEVTLSPSLPALNLSASQTTISAPIEPLKPQITNKMEEDIEAIKCLMERISGNLTKISGMMGKVFCSLNEKSNS